MNFMIMMKRAGHAIKPHLPKIAVAAGVGAMGAAAVMAAKETHDKLPEVENDIKALIEQAKADHPDDKKELAKARLKAAGKLVKVYWPALALSGVGAGLIFGGVAILDVALTGTVAALTLTEESFQKYRENVIATYGEEVDAELRANTRTVKTVVTHEDGTTEELEVKVADISDDDLCCFYFDETCGGYCKKVDGTNDIDYNLMFLEKCQKEANITFAAMRYCSVQDVYDLIGKPRKKGAEAKAWLLGDEKTKGDGEIHFRPRVVQRVVNGEIEDAILLDLNCECASLDRAQELGYLE